MFLMYKNFHHENDAGENSKIRPESRNLSGL
jgi:hypothetical protein